MKSLDAILKLKAEGKERFTTNDFVRLGIPLCETGRRILYLKMCNIIRTAGKLKKRGKVGARYFIYELTDWGKKYTGRGKKK